MRKKFCLSILLVLSTIRADAQCETATVSLSLSGPDQYGEVTGTVSYDFADSTNRRLELWVDGGKLTNLGVSGATGTTTFNLNFACDPGVHQIEVRAFNDCDNANYWGSSSGSINMPTPSPSATVAVGTPANDGTLLIDRSWSFPNGADPAPDHNTRYLMHGFDSQLQTSWWASLSGSDQITHDVTYMAEGAHTYELQAHDCDGAYVDVDTGSFTVSPIDITLTVNPPDLDGSVVVDIAYDFPMTSGGREIRIWTGDGPEPSSVTYSPQQQSGTIVHTISGTCFPPGSVDVHGTARVGPRYAEDQGTFNIDQTPDVEWQAPQHAPDGSVSVDLDVEFKHTNGGFVQVDWLPNGDFAGYRGFYDTSFPREGTVTQTACAAGGKITENTYALVGKARACGLEDTDATSITVGCSAAEKCVDCVGNPIRTTTGSNQLTEVDPLPFRFVRTYESRWGARGWFGEGWSTIFDASLRTFTLPYGGERLLIRGPDLAGYIFAKVGSDWIQVTPEANTPSELIYDAALGEYRHRLPGEATVSVYRNGRLESIQSPDGAGIDITYDTAGAPLSVDSRNGNWSVDVVTGNGRVTSLDVVGVGSWTYAYSASLDDLLTVTAPDAEVWRSYVRAGYGITETIDGEGNVISAHTYDSAGRTITSTSPGHEMTVSYDALPGRVPNETVSKIDQTGEGWTYYYSRFIAGKWRTVEIQGSCDCGTDDAVYAHDQAGRVVREQNARGYITEKTWDSMNRITSRRTSLRPSGCDPETDLGNCRLDPDSLLTETLVETASTELVSFEYGSAEWPTRPTRTIEESLLSPGNQKITDTTYDPITGTVLTRSVSGYTGSPVQPETRTVTTTLYDGIEGPAFSPGGDFQTSWETLPQPAGQRKQVDGTRTDVSDVTSWVYYPVDPAVPASWRGMLAATSNALGHVTRYSDYDAFGNARKITSPNGVTTTLQTDVTGMVTSSTLLGEPGCDTNLDPLCATDITSSSTFDSAGRVLTRTNPTGGVTVNEYDSRGRLAAVMRGPSTTDLRERIEYDYDPVLGNRIAERTYEWTGSWTETRSQAWDYSRNGTLEALIHPDGARVEYEYDAGRNLISTKDENHSTPNTKYSYDAAGRMTKVEQLLDGVWISTTYGYDHEGNLVSVTDPNGNTTTYVYDDFGQMLSQTSPVTGTTTYAYDEAGNLLSTTDARGATTTRSYDALGRVVTSTTALGAETESVTWSYDSGTWGLGQLASMTDPTGSTSYDYTRRGQLARETKTIDGAVYVTSFGYDENGARDQIIYPSGTDVRYGHDYASRPVSAATADGLTTFVSSAEYEPFGPMRSLTYGNGTTRTVTHDTRYRPTSITLQDASAATLAGWGYGYDALGNITSISDLQDPGYSRTFGYDDLNRLVTADTGSTLWGTGSYSYDAMGNMLTTTLGGSSRTFTYQGTTPKLATSSDWTGARNFTYDAAGNEITRGSDAFGYSARNSLTSANALGYSYDGRGVRVATFGDAVAVASISTPSSTVEGGDSLSGTLTLTAPAPAGGITVPLRSDDPLVTVPASVTIAEGLVSSSFTITTQRPLALTSVVVEAELGSSVSLPLSVLPLPYPVALDLTPADLKGGESSSAVVQMDRAAPPGGVTIALSSSDPLASVPGTIAVSAGETTGSFSVATSTTATTTGVTISASTDSGAHSSSLTVRRTYPDVASVDLGTGTVVSGYDTSGSVVLTEPAPAEGADVALGSSDPAQASVPGSVTVPGGASSAPFEIETSPVTTSSAVSISGTYGTTETSTLTLQPCQPVPGPAPEIPANDEGWVDDSVPGGWLGGTWNWTTAFFAAGTQSHTDTLTSGMHQHYFGSATAITPNKGDLLVTHVLIDPCNPPRELMLGWQDSAGTWDYFAYWGEDLVAFGNDRKYMGPVPETGEWLRLEVPAELVGLSNVTIRGASYVLYDGRAWFDWSAINRCQSPVPSAPTDFEPADEIWVDDTIPGSSWNWTWDTNRVASGTQSHTHPYSTGASQHGFQQASNKVTVNPEDVLVQYVHLDECETPREIMVQFQSNGSWEHRAYWGENLIGYGTDGTSSRRYMGPLPEAGGWVRLEIPAPWLGLGGKTIEGISFDVYDGKVWWDYSAVSRGTAYPNVAQGRFATQSSVANGAAATLATDGNTSGDGSIGEVATTNVETEPWWEVDLGSVETIEYVDIWNRTDCCGTDLQDYYVHVSSSPFASTDLATTLADANVTSVHVPGENNDVHRVEIGTSGRYLRIQLAGTAALQLAEVDVRVSGWQLANVAVGKSATQSSTLYGAAGGAVDGDTATGVTHTDYDAQAWWEVDLGAVESISSITLWNRTDCCQSRLSNYHVLLSEVPFTSTDLAATQAQPGVIDIHQPGENGLTKTYSVEGAVRYVRVQLSGSNYLSLAEVEVFAFQPPAGSSSLSPNERSRFASVVGGSTLDALLRHDGGERRKTGEPTLQPSFYNAPLVVAASAASTTPRPSSLAPRPSTSAASTTPRPSSLAPRSSASAASAVPRPATLAPRSSASAASTTPRSSASAASVTGPRRYSLYTPELNLLAETEYTADMTPPVQYEYVWFAGAPVAQLTHSVPSGPRAATEVIYTVTDHLGTPRVQTDTTGAIVWYAEHEPYGEVHVMRAGAQRHQPLRFPGQEAEQLGASVGPNGVSSRSYNIFRWYRAGAGRYTQADPAFLVDLSHFSYASTNPLLYMDPLGLFKVNENCGDLAPIIYNSAKKAVDALKSGCCIDLQAKEIGKAIMAATYSCNFNPKAFPKMKATDCARATKGGPLIEFNMDLINMSEEKGHACGCLSAVIAHEAYHHVSKVKNNQVNEKLADELETRCFGDCAGVK